VVLSQSPPSRLMITINRAWTTACTTIALSMNHQSIQRWHVE
jgi:hypothetical protein